jgi:hypothetical protein
MIAFSFFLAPSAAFFVFYLPLPFLSSFSHSLISALRLSGREVGPLAVEKKKEKSDRGRNVRSFLFCREEMDSASFLPSPYLISGIGNAADRIAVLFDGWAFSSPGSRAWGP